MSADPQPQDREGLIKSASLPEKKRLNNLESHGIVNGLSNAQIKRIEGIAPTLRTGIDITATHDGATGLKPPLVVAAAAMR